MRYGEYMTDSTTTDRPVNSTDCQTAVLILDEFLIDMTGLLYSQLNLFVERMTSVAEACGDPIARESVLNVISEVTEGSFEDNGKKMITLESRLIDKMLDLRSLLTSTN